MIDAKHDCNYENTKWTDLRLLCKHRRWNSGAALRIVQYAPTGWYTAVREAAGESGEMAQLCMGQSGP